MRQTDETVAALIQAIRDAGYAVRSYSGRGKRCVGVEIKRSKSLVDFVLDVLDVVDEDERDAVAGALRDPREDSMGLGQILYWPDVAWPEGETDDEVDS